MAKAKPNEQGEEARSLGAFVRQRRKSLNLKVKDLARATEVSTSYISQVELGRQVDPSLRTLRSLAEALNVDLPTLLGLAVPDQTSDTSETIPPELAHVATMIPIDSDTLALLARLNLNGHSPTSAADWLMIVLVIRRACGLHSSVVSTPDVATSSSSAAGSPRRRASRHQNARTEPTINVNLNTDPVE